MTINITDFNHLHDKGFIVDEDGALKGTIFRHPESTKWTFMSVDGEIIDSDRYRSDLIERIQCGITEI